ncbi:MAG: hypothetical protein ACKPKO_59945, partial [Candidatus Fonsibacter sp.]
SVSVRVPRLAPRKDVLHHAVVPVRHGPYLKKPPLAFKHPFGTIIASTYYCYTEPQTNKPMHQLKGTQPTTTITNELPTLR